VENSGTLAMPNSRTGKEEDHSAADTNISAFRTAREGQSRVPVAKTRVSEDAQMRLRGQHVPEAPRRAHGQLNFVFSAPVCLFPVLPPAGQSATPSSTAPLRFP